MQNFITLAIRTFKQHVIKKYFFVSRSYQMKWMWKTNERVNGNGFNFEIVFSILDIRVPLMWKDNVHFTGKTGGDCVFQISQI